MAKPKEQPGLPTLQGHVEFRLDLSDNVESNRRKDSGYFFLPKEVSDPHDEEETLSQVVGGTSSEEEYSMVIPQGLTKIVCDAARYNTFVTLTLYSTQKIVYSGTEKNIIHLHHGGIKVDVSPLKNSDNKLKQNSQNDNLKTIITLSELNKIECCENEGTTDDTHQRNQKQLVSNTNKSKHYFSVSAIVDAISPIIAAVPSDPFALIEIYEKEKGEGNEDEVQEQHSYHSTINNNGPMTAVVVLRGKEALACHTGIHPGDSITFEHARKQRWHVPSSLAKKTVERLHFRAPSHVLVVDKAQSVSWKDKHSALQGDQGQPNNSAALCFPPLPSTIVPLTSLQGEIVSIQYQNAFGGKKGSKIIHSIDFIPHYQTQLQPTKHATLYVTYYPVTQSESLGLVPGTIIRAVNVHLLSSGAGIDKIVTAYGACLRSTITILQCSDDVAYTALINKAIETTTATTTRRKESQSDQPIAHRPTKRPRSASEVLDTSTSPPTLGETYLFSRILRPYKSLLFYDYLERWYKECLANFEGQKAWSTLLPSLDEIIHNLIETNSCSTAKDAVHNKGTATAKKKKKKRKTKQRDPYAEFFDHGHHDFDVMDVNTEGCEPCCFESSTLPAVIGLDKIRSTCVKKMYKEVTHFLKPAKRVRNQSQDCELQNGSNIPGGWSSSIHLSKGSFVNEMIGSDLNEDNVSNNFRLCTGGLLTPDFNNCQCSSICDGLCAIPICEVSSTQTNKEGKSFPLQQDGCFAIVEIESIIVSCICLGAVRGASELPDMPPEDEMREIQLPYTESLKPHRIGAQVKGSCSFFQSCEKLFLVSVQLRCRSFQVIHERPAKSTSPIEKIQSASTLLSIRECLQSSFFGSQKENTSLNNSMKGMVGMLTRLRFKFAKIRGDYYNDCLVTLSDDSDSGSKNTTTLQTVEFKLSVPVPFEKRKKVQQSIEELTGMSRSIGVDDQVSLATAWWSIADSRQSAALLAGGWDEFQKNHNRDTNDFPQLCKVRVQIPLTSIHQSEQGYVRIRVGLENLRALCASVTQKRIGKQVVKQKTTAHGAFHYIGGSKFLPGMLDRRPSRQIIHPLLSTRKNNPDHLVFGELCSCPNLESFPISTISSMIERVCCGIKNQSKSAVEPSLVQMVPNARILTLTYCRAQAECSRCFRALSDKRGTRKIGKGKSLNVTGVVASVSLAEQESFWSRPLAINHSSTGSISQQQQQHQRKQEKLPPQNGKRKEISRIQKTCLRCPNDCPIELAVVKWECSGILDDGTGQAKLYAEREAALTLLGGSLDVRAVEEGAWKIDGGVTFSKGVPPKSYIKQAVLEAQSLARQMRTNLPHLSSKEKARPLNENDILSLLTPEARAEYVLQWHCRRSRDPNRSLNFFCRCKPLADGTFHLNQTQLEVVSRRSHEESDAITMDITSYSLFPLKLNLVDCFSVESSTQKNWDTLNALEIQSKKQKI